MRARCPSYADQVIRDELIDSLVPEDWGEPAELSQLKRSA